MSGVKRRTWYTRRRTKSVGSMPFSWQSQNVLLQVHQTQSDEMCSSSTSKDKDYHTYYQSDSDDICSDQCEPCFAAVCSSIPNNIESDSFNKNSPCRRPTRKKRKFERIAMEIEISGNDRFFTQSHAGQSYSKKNRPMRHSFHCPSNRLWLSMGKRKRSAREKLRNSMDGESSDFGRDSKVLAISKLSLDDYPMERNNSMEVSYTAAGVSSSSLSSSESETELYTNDEGREDYGLQSYVERKNYDIQLRNFVPGDDEQSDWIGDVGLAASTSFSQVEHIDANNDAQTYYHKYLRGTFEPIVDKRILKFISERSKDNSSRRKDRLVKSNFTFVLPSGDRTQYIPSFLNNSQSKNKMDVDSGSVNRRHTFSGYKKRKRIPISCTTDTSDKSSEIYNPTVHKLSDISSSDSKDSLK